MLKKVGWLVLGMGVFLVLGAIYLVPNQYRTCSSEYSNVFIDTNEIGVVSDSVPAFRTRFVRVDFDNFTDKICVKLFDDAVYEVILKDKGTTIQAEWMPKTDRYYWTGMIKDTDGTSEILFGIDLQRKTLSGSIHFGPRFFVIESLENGLHAIYEPISVPVLGSGNDYVEPELG